MRKFGLTLLASLFIFASCDMKSKNNEENKQTEATEVVSANKVYSGVVPAASCEGIDYTITINADSTANIFMDYLGTEPKTTLSLKGKVEYLDIESEGEAKKCIKYVDNEDKFCNHFFIVESDSTIVMAVDSVLNLNDTSKHYTLTLKK
ncbi:MAG: copper resistance protein NlpE N-terminal domain-containing protein [Bacteroides sp.]|nr:copper resistance protein NlpE N-terminal domain-containing protein [Bacteroides sp.]